MQKNAMGEFFRTKDDFAGLQQCQRHHETEAHKQKITTLQEVGFSSCRKKTVPLFFIRFLAQCQGIMRRKLINKK